MKVIAIFLAVIVFALTVNPCCTIAEQEEHKEANCAETENEMHNDCSPFYACGTCTGFTTPIKQVMANALSLKPVQHNSIYLPVKPESTHAIIWQPPKLS